MSFGISNFFIPQQRNASVMSIKLEPRSIQPDAAEWIIFLNMNFIYMSESWPNRMENKTKEAFVAEYDQTLRNRYLEGFRGFFLYYCQKQVIGLSNAYITEENKVKALNIAEFYVEPSHRRKGIASQMKDHIVLWGKEQYATKVKIEVDKDLALANCFWSKFNFTLNSAGSRNVYFTDI